MQCTGPHSLFVVRRQLSTSGLCDGTERAGAGVSSFVIRRRRAGSRTHLLHTHGAYSPPFVVCHLSSMSRSRHTHLLHAYAACRPPFRRSMAPLVETRATQVPRALRLGLPSATSCRCLSRHPLSREPSLVRLPPQQPQGSLPISTFLTLFCGSYKSHPIFKPHTLFVIHVQNHCLFQAFPVAVSHLQPLPLVLSLPQQYHSPPCVGLPQPLSYCCHVNEKLLFFLSFILSTCVILKVWRT